MPIAFPKALLDLIRLFVFLGSFIFWMSTTVLEYKVIVFEATVNLMQIF